jgi:hypothetical protein
MIDEVTKLFEYILGRESSCVSPEPSLLAAAGELETLLSVQLELLHLIGAEVCREGME